VSCFPLTFPVSSEYNLIDLCLLSACATWLARGTHGASTRSTPHGTNTCLLNVSCSNFGCSVKVQLGGLIQMNSRIQMKQVEKEDS
jgi:hypothetical protein